MDIWRNPGARMLAALLLTGAGLAQAQSRTQTMTTTPGAAAVVPSPSTGPADATTGGHDRVACPPVTGTRIPPARDARGRCPDAARTNPAVRSYTGGDVTATGYPGDVGAALQQLDPALIGR